MATKTTPASDLSDDMTSPVIGAEIVEGSSQSPLRPSLEKRKHAETEDVSLQSQPPSTEKRNRGENEELPLSGKHGGCKNGVCICTEGEHEGCGSKGGGGGGGEDEGERERERDRKVTEDYFERLRANFGGRIPPANDSSEQIGAIDLKEGYIGMDVEGPYKCCSNPFTPLHFKQDPVLYNELKEFGVKAVARFDYHDGLTFEDIEEVTSCCNPCQHHLVTMNVKDLRKNRKTTWTTMRLRGKVPNGFLKAEAGKFVLLSLY